MVNHSDLFNLLKAHVLEIKLQGHPENTTEFCVFYVAFKTMYMVVFVLFFLPTVTQQCLFLSINLIKQSSTLCVFWSLHFREVCPVTRVCDVLVKINTIVMQISFPGTVIATFGATGNRGIYPVSFISAPRLTEFLPD